MGYSERAKSGEERTRAVVRALWAVLFANLAVSAIKLAYGAASGSLAMSADGFHSLFDGASNVFGLVGVYLARRPADATHPYGHGKLEVIASAGIAGLLLLAGWSVGSSALERLSGGGGTVRADAGSFAVMVIALAVSLFVTLWERARGRRLGSEILLADAAHTGSDVLVSAGVIVGLIAVRLGVPMADPVIALAVAAVILRTAWVVFRRAGDTFADRARIPADEICDIVCAVPGVLGCHDVRTRGSSSEVYVDLHVQVDPGETLAKAHDIAETVERSLYATLESVADVIVHIEPLDEYQADKSASQDGARLA